MPAEWLITARSARFARWSGTSTAHHQGKRAKPSLSQTPTQHDHWKPGLATPGLGAIFAEEVPEGQFDAFAPDNIAPLVAYLAQEKCPVTGKVFAVQGGAISVLSGWTGGQTIETDGPWDLHDLAERLPALG